MIDIIKSYNKFYEFIYISKKEGKKKEKKKKKRVWVAASCVSTQFGPAGFLFPPHVSHSETLSTAPHLHLPLFQTLPHHHRS